MKWWKGGWGEMYRKVSGERENFPACPNGSNPEPWTKIQLKLKFNQNISIKNVRSSEINEQLLKLKRDIMFEISISINETNYPKHSSAYLSVTCRIADNKFRASTNIYIYLYLVEEKMI
jgi:hypothetical protein